MADTTRASAPTRPDRPLAQVVTLRVATPAEVARLIDAGIVTGDRVVLTDLPRDGLLLGGEAA